MLEDLFTSKNPLAESRLRNITNTFPSNPCTLWKAGFDLPRYKNLPRERIREGGQAGRHTSHFTISEGRSPILHHSSSRIPESQSNADEPPFDAASVILDPASCSSSMPPALPPYSNSKLPHNNLTSTTTQKHSKTLFISTHPQLLIL